MTTKLMANTFRILLIMAIIILSFVLINLRKKTISKDSRKEVVSQVAIWQDTGRPVKVMELKKTKINTHSKLTTRLISKNRLQAFVTNKDIKKLKIGLTFTIEDDHQKTAGIITNIGKQQQLSTGLYPVTLKLDRIPSNLNGTKIVHTIVNTENFNDVIAVPKDAVLNKNNRSFVWIVNEGTAHIKEVKLGRENYKTVQVRQGLKAGDLLIIEGNSSLSPEIKVKIVNK